MQFAFRPPQQQPSRNAYHPPPQHESKKRPLAEVFPQVHPPLQHETSTDFVLPPTVHPEGWAEFKPWANIMRGDQVVNMLAMVDSVADVVIMALNGVERLDPFKADPTAGTVGVWMDRQGIFRGGCRIVFVSGGGVQ